MAGIERVGPGRTATIGPWGGMRPAARFSVSDDERKPNALGAPVALSGFIGALDEETGDDTSSRQHAGALLTELAALQRSLLGGGDPVAVLQRLEDMLGAAPDTRSPALLALLAAVRMRARVELARRRWGVNR